VCATRRDCVIEACRSACARCATNKNGRSAAISPRDWTLLALAQSSSGSLQPLQLQKALCLLSEQLSLPLLQCDTFYDFTPNEYGPFSAAIYSDIEELASSGLVIVSHDGWPGRHFVLTREGREAAQQLPATIEPEAVRCLTAVLAWITSFELRELLQVDLATFPGCNLMR
jgi:hypothetical protein